MSISQQGRTHAPRRVEVVEGTRNQGDQTVTYTINVPETFTYAGRFDRLFDWIDSGSIESSDFLNLCFSGSVNAKEARAVARSFGVSSEETFPLFWEIVLACYFDKPLAPACRLSDRYWSELLTNG